MGRPRNSARYENVLMNDRQAAEAFLKFVFGNRFDWESEHYNGTPNRFMRMLRELTMPEEFDFTTFRSESDNMVVIKDIEFVSLCAHHIVPFMGVCHIAYIPRGHIAGLSKFARLVKNCAKTLTVQEELTHLIAGEIEEYLNPLGVGVIMEAEHLCMTIRGVQSPGTKTITSSMSGVFLDENKGARQEFLRLAGKA